MKKAFTLIEMMTAVGIIVIISAAAVVSLSATSSQKKLDSAAQELQSALYEALALSFAPYDQDEAAKFYGYGIYLDKGGESYILFKEKSSSPYKYTGGQDIDIKTYKLPRGVVFTDFYPPDADANKASIVFTLPMEEDPIHVPYIQKTFFNNKEWRDGEIELKSGDATRMVHINSLANYIWIGTGDE